ncbi:MAG: hypothetical protein B7Z69_05555 [Actinobacteria bacterium 21-73-9]|nr:MAG: hypothetical protein B7Z69_05555 [Actinobacteria bacterium 21-73-9]
MRGGITMSLISRVARRLGRRFGRVPVARALAVATLAGAALISSAPAGAATLATVVDAGTTFSGVVTVGTNVWAYAQGSCGANPNEPRCCRALVRHPRSLGRLSP